MHLYYDTVARPIELEEAVGFLEGNRHVADTKVGKYRVSTVFLCIDHGFGNSTPLLYETMVFKGESWSELEQRRYHNAQEAHEGHEEVVKKYRRPWRRVKDVV